MADERYPAEVLGPDDDDGTMPSSLEELTKAIVGQRIVSAETKKVPGHWYGTEDALVITLDSGKQVEVIGNSDCCAYTDVNEFFLDPNSVDHMIMGVGTTDGFNEWHIYADYGDIMKLKVGWSCGNPFYYGYGFTIRVKEINGENLVEEIEE